MRRFKDRWARAARLCAHADRARRYADLLAAERCLKAAGSVAETLCRSALQRWKILSKTLHDAEWRTAAIAIQTAARGQVGRTEGAWRRLELKAISIQRLDRGRRARLEAKRRAEERRRDAASAVLGRACQNRQACAPALKLLGRAEAGLDQLWTVPRAAGRRGCSSTQLRRQTRRGER